MAEVTRPLFFLGVHKPSMARHADRTMLSINALENRRSDFAAHSWILDSGAFTRITTGRGHMPIEDYARQANRWAACGNLLAVVSQDWMCEPFVLTLTGATVAQHQRWTLERYDALRPIVRPYLMPVLQGYAPADYVHHAFEYGDRLTDGAWVGVGSVCKRNASPWSVVAVLEAIQSVRPDLRLHGFGLKQTALRWEGVSSRLYSCDSLAWSFAARYNGGDRNDAREGVRYAERLNHAPIQRELRPCAT